MTIHTTEAGPQTSMMSLSWVNLAVVVIVGIFSLLFLWLRVHSIPYSARDSSPEELKFTQ